MHCRGGKAPCHDRVRGGAALDPLQAVILGTLQGLTEFLPVSSSGHLVLGKELLGIHLPGAGFEIFAHFGTLLAVVLHYRRDLVRMAASALRLRNDADGRMALYVVIGTIPAVVIGLLLKDRIEGLFEKPATAAAMLLVTGTVLYLTRWAPRGGAEVGGRSALLIGVAQAFALLPGISRSGSTISAGLFLGVDRAAAARFAFLLAVPAIAGPALLESAEVIAHPPGGDLLLAYGLGAATAFLSGLVALRLLLRVVARGRLSWFSFYCVPVGVVALLLLLP